MAIGRRIKEAREMQRLSQSELADLINVSKQTMYKYENDIVTNVPSDKIEEISNICRVSPAWLMGWDSGDDDDNYYIDPEASMIAQDIFNNKELRLLFDAARDADPEDLKATHDILLALKRRERGED